MRLSFYMDDYETEKIFSYLRWIFLFVAIVLFYAPFISEQLQFEKKSFIFLLAMGFIYMGLAQIALHLMDPHHKYFPIITKAGIIFDYIALFWLLALSGGVTSPLFAISYLLIMHATIYWRTRGAILSSLAVSLGYVFLMVFEQLTFNNIFMFVLNLGFIWIVGVFGSLIVIRERMHMKQKKQFHELVVTDYITGLYNHRHFQEHLRTLTNQSTVFNLVMGDIDYFKSINDRYGHLVGDEVLRVLGNTFSKISEKYNGQAFRYGGEEFAFLLPDIGEAGIKKFFQELYESINAHTFTEANWTISMSFGVACSREAQSADYLLSYADQLLYKSKENGKGQVQSSNGLLYCNSFNHEKLKVVGQSF